MKWFNVKPANPMVGDCFIDVETGICYIWIGIDWRQIMDPKLVPPADNMVPTNEQMKKHPSLKQAWNEYVVIRKLLGL